MRGIADGKWVHKFMKGRQNEPKTERPHTFKMSEYAVSEMLMIMHQVMLQWARVSTCRRFLPPPTRSSLKQQNNNVQSE